MSTDPRLALVERFFSGTGSSYDSVVRIFTGGIDGLWKQEMMALLPPRPERIIDLAAGTGILTLAIARRFPHCHVVGVELRSEYLDIAKARAAYEQVPNAEFILGRAEAVQLPESADAITGSYLPKYADLPQLARTMRRTLRPGGVAIMHDFTYPTPALLGWAWEHYMRVMWLVGGSIYPQWARTFRELPILIRQTKWVEELQAALRAEGFGEIRQQRLTLGGAALVSAKKELAA
jgi:demethylmenaquinone methyltransferase/2-methoxy-6-polyprenyl-1,4-benzoquinol methylase